MIISRLSFTNTRVDVITTSLSAISYDHCICVKSFVTVSGKIYPLADNEMLFPFVSLSRSSASISNWSSALQGNFFVSYYLGPDFDDVSSFFPCEIDDAIQYINLGYGAQAPKIVIL